MKKHLFSFFIFLYCGFFIKAQINYNFSTATAAYTSLATYTTLHSTSVDEAISPATNIGFTFYYGCQAYTTFQASSNGVMFLGTTAAGSNLTNNLSGSSDRPAIAPLWDDLSTDATASRVCYTMTGAAGSRILTVEWFHMLWNWSATTWGISFEVKLYEGTNRIEFTYQRNGGLTANLNIPSASIGISGVTNADFYSLQDVSAAPVISKVTENTSIASKPATNQIYR